MKMYINDDWNAHSSTVYPNKVTTLGATEGKHVKLSNEIRYCVLYTSERGYK